MPTFWLEDYGPTPTSSAAEDPSQDIYTNPDQTTDWTVTTSLVYLF
jgi:hypothetical protein